MPVEIPDRSTRHQYYRLHIVIRADTYARQQSQSIPHARKLYRRDLTYIEPPLVELPIDECRNRDEFMEVLDRYVDFYNKHRPCYALGYDTPVNYRKRYYKGELERKNTFENRVLSEKPKFVRKRRKQANSEEVSTFLD